MSWVRDRVTTVRARQALLDRLFGPDSGRPVSPSTAALDLSDRTRRWPCETAGCVPDRDNCVYCLEEGA